MSIDVDKAVVSRLSIFGKRFEILVDPKKAFEFRKGKEIPIEEILAYPAIYKDARKAMEASTEDLKKVFGTSDVYEIAKRIVKKGEFQLTTEQRREFIENKKIQIANLISKKGINPQTNTPHPPQRILNAMERAGISIDPFKSAEEQVEKVVEEIRKFLPLKFEKIVYRIKFPAEFYGKVYSQLKNFGEVSSEKWLSDGSFQAEIEIFAGIKNDFLEKISTLTRGNFEIKEIGKVEL